MYILYFIYYGQINRVLSPKSYATDIILIDMTNNLKMRNLKMNSNLIYNKLTLNIYKIMDSYLCHKYSVLLKLGYEYDIPREIIQSITSLIHNFSQLSVFVGLTNTIIIENSKPHDFRHRIFNNNSVSNIDSCNIKEICYCNNGALILYYDNKLYKFGDFVSGGSQITYLANNVKTVTSYQDKYAYITNDCELYICSTCDAFGRSYCDSKIVKSNITNVKDINPWYYGLIVLLNDGKVIDIDDPTVNVSTQYLNVPQIKQLVKGGLTHNIMISNDNELYGYGIYLYGDVAKARKSQAIIQIDITNFKSMGFTSDLVYILYNNGEVYTYKNTGYYIKSSLTNKGEISQLRKLILPPVHSIYCGSNHAIMVTIDGTIYGCGAGAGAQSRISYKHISGPSKIKLLK